MWPFQMKHYWGLKRFVIQYFFDTKLTNGPNATDSFVHKGIIQLVNLLLMDIFFTPANSPPNIR